MPIIHSEDGVPPSANKLVLKTVTESAHLTYGSTETTKFTPPKGKLWSIIAAQMQVNLAPGGSSGYHVLNLSVGGVGVLGGESNFGARLDWLYDEWSVSDKSKMPSDPTAAALALKSIVLDADNPLEVLYMNIVNATQTQPRVYYFTFLEKSIF